MLILTYGKFFFNEKKITLGICGTKSKVLMFVLQNLRRRREWIAKKKKRKEKKKKKAEEEEEEEEIMAENSPSPAKDISI